MTRDEETNKVMTKIEANLRQIEAGPRKYHTLLEKFFFIRFENSATYESRIRKIEKFLIETKKKIESGFETPDLKVLNYQSTVKVLLQEARKTCFLEQAFLKGYFREFDSTSESEMSDSESNPNSLVEIPVDTVQETLTNPFSKILIWIKNYFYQIIRHTKSE